MTRLSGLAGAVLVIFGASAHAQSWVKLGEGSTGVVDYYDPESVTRTGAGAKIWVLSDHSSDTTVPYARAKRLYVVRCAESTAALAAYLSYAKDGRVLENESVPEAELSYQNISPGSLGSKIANAACAASTTAGSTAGRAVDAVQERRTSTVELRLVVTPAGGGDSMTATNTYDSQAACEADLKAMVAKAREMVGQDAGIEARCGDKKLVADTKRPLPPEKESKSSKPGALSLSCKGYFGLMKTTTSFVFHIDLQEKRFSGTRDGIHDVHGKVGGKGSLLALLFNDATGMNYTAWIDRDAGSFKVDLSNDKLYLMNNITGQCERFAGPKF